MKKALCILAAAAMVICGATSCKKNCTCTTTIDGKDQGTTTIKAKKCADLESETTTMGITTKVTCK